MLKMPRKTKNTKYIKEDILTKIITSFFPRGNSKFSTKKHALVKSMGSLQGLLALDLKYKLLILGGFLICLYLLKTLILIGGLIIMCMGAIKIWTDKNNQDETKEYKAD